MSHKTTNHEKNSRGFTIVELLVVIVVIGILAAITIVSYTGISQKATNSSLQSDLANASNQLKLYYTDNGAYPASLSSNCPVGPPDTKYCLKPSSGNTFTYTATPAGSTSPQAYRLSSTNNSTVYAVTNNTQPAVATSSTSCPTGFIPVPGSGTYGTNDFCVMKYEAKNVSGVATSQEANTPWVSITQTSAITTANAACTGCHLITEAEWMTIAQNVLSVNANWSGGTVGTGCIFRGNAGTLDACGYNGADPESGTGRNVKASLTLTNDEVIWDLSGNVWEWTSGTSTNGQPGITGEGTYVWKEWTAVTAVGTLSPNVFPSGTGISGAGDWDSNYGVGALSSNAGETTLRGLLRGGYWGSVGGAGVLVFLNYAPSTSGTNLGFRVSR